MKILVTGGCGFVGANLAVKIAAQQGWSLRILDNESLGRREHLQDFTGEFIRGDIRDGQVVNNALEGVDAVVHLAADTRVIEAVANPRHNFDVNVVGTFNILEGMRAKNIKRLVNASTAGAIIGTASGAINEAMLPAPMAPYGASKLAVEGYCSGYSGSYGMSVASLRFANVFGPGSFHKGSVVAAFFKLMLQGRPLTIYGDGTQVRDYVYIGDICDGIIAALQRPVTGPIQLGSGNPTTLNELIEILRSVTGIHISVNREPARQGEIHTTYCDISHARSVLDFHPQGGLEERLGLTWAWFLAASKGDGMAWG